MSVIQVRLSDEEEKLIKEYAEANNITIAELFRNTVLERIEDEMDLAVYNQAMQEHKENPEAISFGEMVKNLKS